MILRHAARHRRTATAIVIALVMTGSAVAVPAGLPAFPGAVGQGAAATGGRGDDVVHVTNLLDYDVHKDQPKIPGSLRHAIQSATGPRIIVFDVGGPIKLAGRLEIRKHNLTIAGRIAGVHLLPGNIFLFTTETRRTRRGMD